MPSNRSTPIGTRALGNSENDADTEATDLDVDLTISGISVIEISDPSHVNLNPRANNPVEAALRSISREYDVQMSLTRRLQVLQDFEIVIVCDDSGSMKTPVDGTQRTRWDELCSIVKIVVSIGVKFDSNGIDIYFLNRGSYRNVKHSETVEQAFGSPPSGYTPLVPTLSQIFESLLADRGRDKKLLVFVATDGIPTDQDGNENIPDLEHLMCHTRKADTTYVSFLICTDEEHCVNYLNEWDRTMTNVDVTDDFNTERAKVRSYRGSNHSFSFGDYVVKALIGPIDPEMDALNEPSP